MQPAYKPRLYCDNKQHFVAQPWHGCWQVPFVSIQSRMAAPKGLAVTMLVLHAWHVWRAWHDPLVYTVKHLVVSLDGALVDLALSRHDPTPLNGQPEGIGPCKDDNSLAKAYCMRDSDSIHCQSLSLNPIWDSKLWASACTVSQRCNGTLCSALHVTAHRAYGLEYRHAHTGIRHDEASCSCPFGADKQMSWTYECDTLATVNMLSRSNSHTQLQLSLCGAQLWAKQPGGTDAKAMRAQSVSKVTLNKHTRTLNKHT